MCEGKDFIGVEGGIIEIRTRLKFISNAVGKLAEPRDGTADNDTLCGLHQLLTDLEKHCEQLRADYYFEWDRHHEVRRQLEQCRAM